MRILILLYIASMLSCLADTEAPDSADIEGDPPALHLLVQGSSGTSFFLSYSDSTGKSYEFRDEGQLKVNLAGELRLFLEFEREVNSLTGLKAALQTSSGCSLDTCSCRIDNQVVSLSTAQTVFVTFNPNDTSSCTALLRS